MENVLVFNDRQESISISHIYDLFNLVLEGESLYVITDEENLLIYSYIKHSLKDSDKIFDQFTVVNGIHFIVVSLDELKAQKLVNDLLNIKEKANVRIPLESLSFKDVITEYKLRFIVMKVDPAVSNIDDYFETEYMIQGFDNTLKMYRLLQNVYNKLSALNNIFRVYLSMEMRAEFKGKLEGSAFLVLLSEGESIGETLKRQFLLTKNIKVEMLSYLVGVDKVIKKEIKKATNDKELIQRLFKNGAEITELYGKISIYCGSVFYQLTEGNPNIEFKFNKLLFPE